MTPGGTVAVLGLGLIGGSLARDLAARGTRVVGHDPDPSALRAALDEGVLSAAVSADGEGIEGADAVVLAVPVSDAPALLERLLPRLAAVPLVTDAGSTKRRVVAAAEALGIGPRFVGAHPLAGDHRSGWAASREGLFSGARVWLCPTSSTTPGALAAADALWSSVGGATEAIGAEEHDRRLAWISHLPQLVSTSLGAALASARVSPHHLGRGGRDVTRLAGSSPPMWAGIALENADLLVPAVAQVEAALRALREAMERGDREALLDLLAAARTWADAPPSDGPA